MGKPDRQWAYVETLAYKDTWIGGINSYLDMLYPRLQLMKRFLSDNGSIYIHLDWHAGHYVKVIMDEVFGPENFKNEIIIRRTTKHTIHQFKELPSLQVSQDIILLYSRNPDKKFNTPLREASERQKQGSWHVLFNRADRPTMRYPLLGRTITHGQWMWGEKRAYKAVQNYKDYIKKYSIKMTLKEYWETVGKEIEFVKANPNTGEPEYWVPARNRVPCDNNWMDIQAYSFNYKFTTEKSEAFLKRIIEMGSNPGDLIADFFCGSGTLGAVIEKLNKENSTKPPRQWIMCDLSKIAIQVSRARLVNLDAKPFLIENIGNYQREMIYLHGARIYEMQRIILKLYGATPREERNDLGVRKGENGRLELVYVGYPDRAVTAGKVEELEKITETLDGMGYRKLIILAWDYEYNYSELLENRKKASKREWKAEIESKTIPPEIYEYLKKAKDEEEIESLKDKIYFYEKPYLKLLEPKTLNLSDGKVRATIGLKNYVLFDFPVKKEKDREEIRKIAKDNFASLIDFWAVDWDYDGFTFKSQWQAFRGFGKKIKTVPVKVSKELEKGKEYNIAVRVVDIFGNDATGIAKIDLRGE